MMQDLTVDELAIIVRGISEYISACHINPNTDYGAKVYELEKKIRSELQKKKNG
jgi:hypothetical protein